MYAPYAGTPSTPLSIPRRSRIRRHPQSAVRHGRRENEARDALRIAPGVMVMDQRENDGYITPVESAGDDAVYVSRIRKDPTIKNGLSMWVVSDNLRKGAALNSVQIAEELIRKRLVKAA